MGTLLLVACGADDDTSSRAASAPTTQPVVTRAASSSVPAPGASASTIAARVNVLPAGATVEQIVDATKAALGPTDDLAGALRPFLELPIELPTPLGADITDLAIGMIVGDDDLGHSQDVRVTFDASGTPADLLLFYEAELAAAGLARTGGGEKTELKDRVEFVTFELPAPTGDRLADPGSLEVQVPTEQSSGWVRLSLATKTLSPDLVTRLGRWPGEIPGVERAAARSVRITSPLVVANGYRPGVTLSAGYDVPDTTVGELDQALLGALPTRLYRLREHDRQSPTFTLRRAGFGEVVIALADHSGSSVDSGPYDRVGVTLSGRIRF